MTRSRAGATARIGRASSKVRCLAARVSGRVWRCLVTAGRASVVGIEPSLFPTLR